MWDQIGDWLYSTLGIGAPRADKILFWVALYLVLQVLSLTSRIGTLSDKIDSLEDRIDEAESDAESASSDASDVDGKVDELDSRVKDLIEDIKHISDHLSVHWSHLSFHDEQLKDLEAEVGITPPKAFTLIEWVKETDSWGKDMIDDMIRVEKRLDVLEATVGLDDDQQR
jgi:chromosome segregation ATPase